MAIRRTLKVVVCLAALRLVAFGQDDGAKLEPGRPVERELASAKAHDYFLPLAASKYFAVNAEQRGVDVTLTLHGPDGRQLLTINQAAGTHGVEPLSFVVGVAGRYRLVVQGLNLFGREVTGKYRLTLTQLRNATTLDQRALLGQAAFAEGERLRRDGTEYGWKEALKRYEEALTHWRAVADRAREADALQRLGHGYRFLEDPRQAAAHYEQALELRRALGDRLGEAQALTNLASVQRRLRELKRAAETVQAALKLSRELGVRQLEAEALGIAAAIHDARGEYQPALAGYEQSLTLRRALGDRREEARTINKIGLTYYEMGEAQRALECHEQALAIQKALQERRDEASTLNDIGLVYFELGETHQSLAYFQQAEELSRQLNDRRAYAIVLGNVGKVQRKLGDLKRALPTHQWSLELRRELGDPQGEAVALTNLGQTWFTLGEFNPALDCFTQALARRRAADDQRGAAWVMVNLGLVYAAMHEPERALEQFTAALPLSREKGDAHTEAEALFQTAKLKYAGGALDDARSRLEAALRITEDLRVKAGADLREAFFATVQDYYQLYITVLMGQHERRGPAAGRLDAAALHAAERARGRGTLDLLARARATGTGRPALPQPLTAAEIQRQVLDEDTLLLEYALTDERSYLWVLNRRELYSYELPGRAKIEAAARRVYRLMATRPLDYAPPPGAKSSLLQEYWEAAQTLSNLVLGPAAARLDKRRWLVVGDGALQAVPFGALPPPETTAINNAVAAVLSRFPVSPNYRVAETAEQASGWKIILPPFPVSPQLRTERQMSTQVGSPAGPRQQPLAKAAAAQPLLVAHEVVNLPSASTLALLRREAVGRKPPAKELIVLADPVFGKHDDRVQAAQLNLERSARPAPAPLEKLFPPERLSAELREGRRTEPVMLPRLPFSRDEAHAIIGTVPPGSAALALDFQASRAIALHPALSDYRIIHIATHGHFNDENPDSSGLYFSQVNEQGESQNGFLRVNEIYRLKLNAELVVLSACETGLGKEVKGEGLVGMTRGFMYAGANRVVAGLWKVNDAATAELMKRFYQGMLGQPRLSPAAALRHAQLEIWRMQKWQAPYYWGAFVVQGEW